MESLTIPSFQLPIKVELNLQNEFPFSYSKNGFSFVVNKLKHFESSEWHLIVKVTEGSVQDIDATIASPLVITRTNNRHFTIKNTTSSTTTVVVNFKVAFAFKERRLINACHTVNVPLEEIKDLKFDEAFRQNIVLPVVDNLTFDALWIRSLTPDGTAIYRYVITNKAGVKINDAKTAYSVYYKEDVKGVPYLPFKINFLIDLDEFKGAQLTEEKRESLRKELHDGVECAKYLGSLRQLSSITKPIHVADEFKAAREVTKSSDTTEAAKNLSSAPPAPEVQSSVTTSVIPVAPPLIKSKLAYYPPKFVPLKQVVEQVPKFMAPCSTFKESYLWEDVVAARPKMVSFPLKFDPPTTFTIISDVDGQRTELSREKFAKASVFFEGMFADLADSEYAVTTMFDISTIYEIEAYCDDGEYNPSEIDYDVYKFAKQYAMEDLKNKCIEAFGNLLNPTNVLDVLKFAGDEKLEDLKEKCFEVLKDEYTVL